MRTLLRLLGLAWAATFVGAIVGAVTARQRVRVEDAADANEIALLASFGPLDYRSTAPAFRGGGIECWYGGGTVDLRGATLDPAGATLRVRAIFGGGQIVVPSTWPVVTEVSGIGGIKDARDSAAVDPSTPTLRIDGLCLLGGFAVTSEPAEGSLPVPA